MPTSVCRRITVAAVVASVSVTKLAFGQGTTQPAGGEVPTLPPVEVSATRGDFYNQVKNFVGSAEVGDVNGTFTVTTTNIVETRARGFVGNSFQDITNEAVQDAHWAFDIHAGYRVHKPVEILVIGENNFNERYVADGFSRGLAAPRQFSGGLRLIF
jgi:hypothetical protein